ncbi:MAG: Spy/CpxP family protein refolding chaperone [Amphritea sp.]|nr:Spy/CpxP family protein refolding chaperone [Amphritea sp.]
MKKRNKIIIAAVTSIALVGGGLTACNHHRSPEERADYMMEKITSKLELTAPQMSQLEQLKNELLDVRQTMLAERDTVHNAVNELLNQPILDQQRALKLAQDRTETINQKAPQVIAAFADFYDNLNPEQQTMLREKVQEHKEQRHHWRH